MVSHGPNTIGKPRVSPLLSLNTSAVIRYLICVYASHFFAGRPYHFSSVTSALILLPFPSVALFESGTRMLYLAPLVATSADSVPSSYIVRITIAPIGTTFGNLQQMTQLKGIIITHVSAVKQDRKARHRSVFLPVSKVRTNKLYIFRQCQMTFYRLQFKL
jgi:hypothetical protein